MEELAVPLVFFAVITGFVTLGVGLNILSKWAQHRFTDREARQRFEAMEDRLAELEERLDFTERALTEAKTRQRLEP